MPEQVLPTIKDYDIFANLLRRKGFRLLTRIEIAKEFRRLALQPPRRVYGREEGFVFSANGIDVYVWTTWLADEGRAREADSGWVLMKQDDEEAVAYFARPVHRTKNFFHRLYQETWLAWFRALNRPLCPEEGCKSRMSITRGVALKSRFWCCMKKEGHQNHKPVFLSWDFGLPPKAIVFLEKIRSERRRYREKLKKAGKTVRPAVLTRRRWVPTKSEGGQK